MNLYVFCIHISIMLLLQYALAKTLPEDSEKDSESESKDSSDTDSIHETNHRSFNHLKSDRLKGHIRRRRANEEKSTLKKQCAVMYKNEEPVGILQPYKDSYQFLPIHSDEHIPVDISPFADSQNAMKRDTSSNTQGDEDAPELGDETLKKVDDSSPFSDERYPYIFAKFKVDSRIEKPEANDKPRSLHKRESRQSLVDEKHSDSLSSTLSKIRTSDEGAEVELRSILSDMGLIDDEVRVDKREAELNEDEDLEHGTNKINLIKLDSNDDRPKRDDLDKKQHLEENHNSNEKNAKRSETATKHYNMIEIPEPKQINEEEYIDQYLNKNDDTHEKEKAKDVEKRSDEVAAQMEHEIKAKLQKIKEEVRSEIDKIKSSGKEELEEDGDGDEEQAQEKEKSQRRKRHVISTLVDEETSDINPLLSADNSLVPKRRRKRSLADEDVLPGNKELKERENISGKETFLPDLIETNFIIDLNQEVEEPSGIDRQQRDINGEYNPRIERYEDEETGKHVTSYQANNTRLGLLKRYEKMLKRITELEKFEHGRSIESRNMNQSLRENSSNESTFTNQYFSTTAGRFLIRNLKEYDEELSNDNNDDTNNYEDETLIKEKRSCKCSNGDKDCKCGKAPGKSLRGADGSNFEYVDGVPRLVNKPIRRMTKKREKSSNNDDSLVKLRMLPLPPEKRSSSKENIKYRKSRKSFYETLVDGGYTLDIDPDIYRITEENPKSLASRRKRDSFSELVAIHGGGPVIDHLIAIRERSMLPGVRVKRNAKDKDQTDQQLTLTDMSGEDLFGALPQNFEGELARFKRVKRTN